MEKQIEYDTLLSFLSLAEKLKCRIRHSWTSEGRRESVAEHTYRLMVFAWLVKEEFPDCDMDRVLKLCLFHDLGEAVTGDIPCFEKNDSDEKTEEEALDRIAALLPGNYRIELEGIFREITEKKTEESQILHALDKMEAVIQHNEASIDTWLPLEYELQLTYGQEQTRDIPFMKSLRERLYRDSVEKIERDGKRDAGRQDGYQISSDREKISLTRVTELLQGSYWAKDRSKEEIRRAMEHSVPYGVYDREGYMVGYARVITDDTTTFYLCDVIIDQTCRGQGLGKRLMGKIMEDFGSLHGVLHTEDAAAFYEAFGFHAYSPNQHTLMEKEREKRS